jgi:hypothetical protein
MTENAEPNMDRAMLDFGRAVGAWKAAKAFRMNEHLESLKADAHAKHGVLVGMLNEEIERATRQAAGDENE